MARLKRRNPISTPKQAHACDSCDKSYTTAGELRKHHNCHTLPFKCTCTRGFSSPNDLHRHEITCQKKKPDLYWVCTESGCDGIKQWPRKDNFKAHLDRKHPLKNNPDFIQQCQRRLDVVQDSGQNHIAHQGEKPSHTNNDSSPTDVQLEFENSTQFTGGLHDQPQCLHDKRSHDGMESIKSYVQSVPDESLEQRQSRQVLKQELCQCPVCGKEYSRRCELRKHMKRHERPWHCTHGCSQRFGTKYDWKRHEHTKHSSLTVWICREPYKAAECQEKLYTVMDFKAHLLNVHQRESPNSRELTDFTSGMSCPHFWCGFCGEYVQSQPMQDCLKVRYDHLGDHFLGLAEPSDFRMFKFEPQQTQVGHGDTFTASKDPIEMDTPPQPAPAPRQTTGRTSLNNDKIKRMSALAKREITRLEIAQKRAHLQAANHERAAGMAAQAAQAAAANISSTAVDGRQQLHERGDIQRLNKIRAHQESLRLRTNAQDAKMYAGVKYERKTQGPFSGKLVSQGTIISIDGEDYVEYRVLKKPLPLLSGRRAA